MSKIKFEINKPGPVEIRVVNVIGSILSSVSGTYEKPGSYEVDFKDEQINPGKYYYKIYDTSGGYNPDMNGYHRLIQTGTLIIGNYSNKKKENLDLFGDPIC